MARRGTNPTKVEGQPPPYGEVRLILPVYLPALEGYFADGLRVLEATLTSIAATIDSRVLVTVIDNGSTREVAAKLTEHLQAGLIDRVVHNALNRGKVDAVLAELRSSYEPISVVTDSDVVFRPGWVDALLAALEAFPECGMLSLHPAPDLRWHASSSTIAARGTGTRLVRAPVVDAADLERFYQSVGRVMPPQHPQGNLLVSRGGKVLGLGFAHFAFAVRREVLIDLPLGPSLSSANGADVDYFELPADAMGWWCLSVPRALVHHVGNTLDSAEERRIAEFSAQVITDRPSGDLKARIPRGSRYLPGLVRRSILRAAALAERRPILAQWLMPERQVQLETLSATQTRSPIPASGGGS